MPNFDTPAPITAIVDIPAGSVRLTAADRADTAVEIRPADATKSRDVKMADLTTVDYRDGVLRVHAPAKNQILGPSGIVEVTVQLPAGSQVEIKAASTEVRTLGRFGDVTIESAHGPITLDEVASARLSTLAGDVTVARLTGPARISTAKGDIRVVEAVRGKVELRTEAGDVSIGAATGVSASLDAGTSYGRVHNALMNTEGAGAQLDIHATTAYGDITARSL